jgi:hypothetical protein
MVIVSIVEKVRWEFDFDDAPALNALFTKLYEYKKPAGFGKNDGLCLTKQEKDWIKHLYDCFDQEEPPKDPPK